MFSSNYLYLIFYYSIQYICLFWSKHVPTLFLRQIVVIQNVYMKYMMRITGMVRLWPSDFFVGRGRVCRHSILAVSEDEKYRLLGCWALNYHVGSTMTFSKYPKWAWAIDSSIFHMLLSSSTPQIKASLEVGMIWYVFGLRQKTTFYPTAKQALARQTEVDWAAQTQRWAGSPREKGDKYD